MGGMGGMWGGPLHVSVVWCVFVLLFLVYVLSALVLVWEQLSGQTVI